MKTRLGLDIGTNSIGWALIRLDDNNRPFQIISIGSRIFPNSRTPDKNETPLAVGRRIARGIRRNRTRFHERKDRLLRFLQLVGLFPTELTEMESLKYRDVYALRVRALDQALSAHELGRVLIHLNQKRGFLSGRKESTEEQKNKIRDRIVALKQKLQDENFRSYGEFLYSQIQKGKSTKANEQFYPERALLKQELELIISIQKSNHPQISDEQWLRIQNIILDQRKLKDVETGPCSLYPDKKRSFKFLPSFEKYRVLCELYNCRYFDDSYEEKNLTIEQIDDLYAASFEIKEMKQKKIIKTAQLSENVKFKGFENSDFKIKGQIESAKFAFVLNEKWTKLSITDQDNLALAIFEPLNQSEVDKNIEILKLRECFKSFSESEWNELKSISPSSDATQAFSTEALQKLVGLTLSEHRSPLAILQDLRKEETTEGVPEKYLKYYGEVLVGSVTPVTGILKDIKGQPKAPAPQFNSEELRFGKIANPTVHVGLGQLRKVYNAIVDSYGSPDQVHIEFVRDLKMNAKQKIALAKAVAENKDLNQRIDDISKEISGKINRSDRERIRLWLRMPELHKNCVYTGRRIGKAEIFSDEFQVDHILPFSRTWDDSLANKVLVSRSANQAKGNRTPGEWLSGEAYEKMLSQVSLSLGEKSLWRFRKDAMDKFTDENSFLNRQLVDTAYLSKIGQKYLSTVIRDASANIVTSPGKVTALVRRKLGLNKLLAETPDEAMDTKNRSDHRHHALDALVVALVDRAFLMKIAKESSRSKSNIDGRILIEQPWPNFIEDLKKHLDGIIASLKIDHGIQGRFLEDTAYRLIPSSEKENHQTNSIGCYKKNESGTRELIISTVKESLNKIGTRESQLAKITHGKNGQHHKFYLKGEVHHMAAWQLTDEMYKSYCEKQGLSYKKSAEKRFVFVCPYLFDVNKEKNNYDKAFRPHPAARLIFKIHKGDIVSIEQENKQRVCYVVNSISPAGTYVRLHTINTDQYFKKMSFNVFMNSNPRLEFISPLGKIVRRD